MRTTTDNNNWKAFCEGFAIGAMRTALIGAVALLLFALHIHLQQ